MPPLALLEEAAALAPEHDAARRLLDMDSEALSQTALVFQEDGLCPTLRPFRFNIHTWQTGVARVALPIPVLRTSQALGAVGSGSGDLLQVVSDVDALYLAEELDRAPARLLRTATRLLSQEVATRSVMREIDDQELTGPGHDPTERLVAPDGFGGRRRAIVGHTTLGDSGWFDHEIT